MKINKFFEINFGSAPIVLSCPHGGYKKPHYIPNKKKGPKNADQNTYFISKCLINEFKQQDIKINYILSKIHRSKVDFNRPPYSEAAFNKESDLARQIHECYFKQLNELINHCLKDFNKCLLIDFHGFTKPVQNYPDIIFGHVFGKTLNIFSPEKDAEKCKKYWGCSELYNDLSRYFFVDDGLSMSDFNLSYSGGYIVWQYYGVEKVSAIQIEVSKEVRMNQESIKLFIDILINALIKIIKN
ncbi:MAG: N-formylglutamate amidohydrolase [Promethearchaeota archaeon]